MSGNSIVSIQVLVEVGQSGTRGRGQSYWLKGLSPEICHMPGLIQVRPEVLKRGV